MIVRRILFLFLSFILLATACSNDGDANADGTDADAVVQRNNDGDVVVEINGDELVLTSDLPGFWSGSWSAVRSEMVGRYPKHQWPDDPATARPHRLRRPPSEDGRA